MLLSNLLKFLKNLHYKKIDLDLSRVKKVFLKTKITKIAKKIVLVSGTNGKGTTCKILEDILLFYNQKVGVYSSPHILNYKERIRINGKILSDKFHIDSINFINKIRKKISLSYFEFSTLSAFYIFKKCKLDYAILEVGMGGRLDATNIIEPDVSIITNIDIDHTNWLGKNRYCIAKEKFEIFRKKKPSIIGTGNLTNKEIDLIKKKKSILYRKNFEWHIEKKNTHWNWIGEKIVFSHLPYGRIPPENIGVAIAATQFFEDFKVEKKNLKNLILKSRLIGRFHIIYSSPTVILDGAHNPHAAKKLSKFLNIFLKKNKTIRAILGILSDKDIQGIVEPLRERIKYWYCTNLNTSRGYNAEEISSKIKKKTVFVFKNSKKAWNKAIFDSCIDDCILVFGSFYTVSEILKKIVLLKSKNKIFHNF
ncbi:bifunctional tetrahydrofolate synthase/dihydrofolate synthase [bacterium endosymbiont of Pedicinus badii]|uniref:bifunctional tetrahydrofolate synthase/dihydrofolate synthase n=1 Tax=bacterium endosymbiont of Pedicinus badii TaxID=1719126 RepID=UPI0009BAD77A|nr:bifunctional tetrahydrofolate synthase/dihydrofolate synthase [bacterium endosymbiont of Pedicinus badii]OQM34462.1 hypothetical protein AOQ89_01055 [bacterium endosymbiont of Pedicinus badii]